MSYATPIQVGGASTTTAVVNPTAQSIAIPNNEADAGGGTVKAKYILLSSDAVCGFRPIQTGETPALATLARVLPNDSLIVNVSGYAEMRLDSPSGTANVTMTPLDNM